ncbi:TatD family hydrolase [Dokdonella koreensis]|uniref:Mg-dependent DNase n=1 Tax=Dokdonella koreensis DS-123 TaxID=1300342 RepID=A0A167G5R9_9GAMM|nr:TatD family hydrolase [Dokdonella koreensis]ANB16183.1 Mg-dependent DNase [Dokdonella koreensis DS-123]
MTLIDIGANLTHESFRPDFDAVLTRARAHGLERIVVTGASAGGSRAAWALTKEHPGFLYATAGVHPHHAVDYDDATDTLLRELLADDRVKAVGETGLDYHRNYSPAAAQIDAFERQLALAVDCGKPLFLHQRDAHRDFIAAFDRVRDRVGRAVVHCFTGERAELVDYLDRDCYIGITGWICDERRGLHLRELAALIPGDRLLIETDAPYLLPRDLVPKPSHRRNEPMYLAHICAAVATARGESIEEIAAATTRNAHAFFAL